MDQLPRHWLGSLFNTDWLLSKTDAACYLLGVYDVAYDYEADVDNLIDGGKRSFTEDEMDKKILLMTAEAEARIGGGRAEDD